MKENNSESSTVKQIMEQIQEANLLGQLRVLLRWVLLGSITGVVVGVIGAMFYHGIIWATDFRTEHDYIILGLPFAGLLIVFLYRLCKDYEDKGTNLVIKSIQAGENLPITKAPLIFISTILTHLFGGSTGRESAALQMGGSIGYNLGKLFRLKEGNVKIITMCGMSAAFSALFGTPMTAAFMAMEIENVGIMYYSALVPCVISALVASGVSKYFGVVEETFAVTVVPEFSLYNAVFTGILAILCAIVSVLFCNVLKLSGRIYKKLIKNAYLRIFVGGCIVSALTFASGTRLYNGAGINVIEMAVKGDAPYIAFLLKMVFTALTLGAGYKGGEIVPALYIGATFGCLYSQLLGFDPALCAAIGMGALFCGVTNCPISSLFICFELFGFKGMPYYLLAVALSYTFSGYSSLYSSQKIVYSKFHNKYVNRDTK
ncbi:chloride channel protein [Butyrivibrio hungatei]|uniref:Voltage gated chloride channel protein n=1 Tax=Butyrivibrio hungatei TaxID=185008 RepID=A0A1D9P486_9FIRM|nr:chloride channel protein [Butyrivibrio hungatei]AOZ97380.1 voltage gated chloride channel protein [Butyrivibrio hungatei]